MTLYAAKIWEAAPIKHIVGFKQAESPEAPTTRLFVIGGKGNVSMINEFQAAALTDLAFVKISTFVEAKRSSARNLLKHAGAWIGDDIKERLEEVYTTRSKAKFKNVSP